MEIAEWKDQRYLQDDLATIRAVDESVGQLLDYLEETGLDENTIIIYSSDQGFYLGEHGWFDKRFMYEESFQMPLLMQYKGHINPNTKIEALTQNIDFAPTILDFCRSRIPDDMQGESFKALVKTGRKPEKWRESLYYHYYEFPGFHSVRAHYGVNTARYKLMHYYKEKNWELFDLQHDPHEIHNIYGKKGTEKSTLISKGIDDYRRNMMYRPNFDHKLPNNEKYRAHFVRCHDCFTVHIRSQFTKLEDAHLLQPDQCRLHVYDL